MENQVLKIPEKHHINIQTIDTYLFQRVPCGHFHPRELISLKFLPVEESTAPRTIFSRTFFSMQLFRNFNHKILQIQIARVNHNSKANPTGKILEIGYDRCSGRVLLEVQPR